MPQEYFAATREYVNSVYYGLNDIPRYNYRTKSFRLVDGETHQDEFELIDLITSAQLA